MAEIIVVEGATLFAQEGRSITRVGCYGDLYNPMVDEVENKIMELRLNTINRV
ncbi:MAG: hypothetical protein ACLUIO_12065 [Neglectibacter timonensis]